MTKQQAKRRRKRYRAGSAYAGDVRPSGILGFLGSTTMIRIIFVGMAFALIAGGGFAIFAGDLFRGTTANDNFVLPEETAQATALPDDVDSVRQYPSAPAITIDASKTYVATIKTPLGDIEVELAVSDAPETVNNFVFLAEDGFYDGLTFYQVTQGFAVQAGDPTCLAGASSGCRGDTGPGYELDESPPGEVDRGSIGMANGSQFFIALTQSQQFDSFRPFGTVVAGLDIAEQLTEGTEIESIEIQAQ